MHDEGWRGMDTCPLRVDVIFKSHYVPSHEAARNGAQPHTLIRTGCAIPVEVLGKVSVIYAGCYGTPAAWKHIEEA